MVFEFLGNKIRSIFKIKRKVNQDLLNEIEELLIEGDVGINITESFIEYLKNTKTDQELSFEEISKILVTHIDNKISTYVKKIEITQKPYIIMMVGVNGSGKTTTISKLIKVFNQKKILIAACDTFRAGAINQLEIWANRLNVEIFIDENIKDAASVAYKAVEKAYNNNYDILFIDTAGRLHNNKGLMDELEKIKKVVNRLYNSAPHEIILVIDGTVGQNAINQIKFFNEKITISGIIITKLDGTAKCGIIIKLIEMFKIPILGICTGESINDFQTFNPNEFAKKLLKI